LDTFLGVEGRLNSLDLQAQILPEDFQAGMLRDPESLLNPLVKLS